MFGNKRYLTEEQVADLLQPLQDRVAQLEKVFGRQASMLEELREALEEYKGRGEVPADVPASDTAAFVAPLATKSNPSEIQRQAPATWFFSMPTAEGVFTESASQEEVGKSIYQMRTDDGVNGHFVMLSTPDAIATAMISVSQFVKPVCRIEGNTHRQPQRIETLDEGVVKFDDGVWKVVAKANVRFV